MLKGSPSRSTVVRGPAGHRLLPSTAALPVAAIALIAAVAACGSGETAQPQLPPEVPADPSCDPTITVPDGLCARIYHPGVGAARHLTVAPNGDVFVAIRNQGSQRGGVVALRDLDGDGRSDQMEAWGEQGGSGIALGNGTLYFATNSAVLRYPLAAGSLTPSGPPETIVDGLPADRNHATKSIALHSDGSLFVGIGSPSNACQTIPRTAGSPGKDPCGELVNRAGIWRFSTDRTGQTQADGERFSTGVRNAGAIALHPVTDELYAVIHGRDQLRELWPAFYTNADGSEKPSEEFALIEAGSDFGWPYCYHDPSNNTKVLAPEYGGNGVEVGRCADMDMPVIGLPGHWAPNALAFTTGGSFPEPYRNGAFVAFHGSWNRSPVQGGYNVVWIPFEGARPTGDWSVFADGFAGGQITASIQADHRPTGVAVGPDGAIYVSDSLRGKIWRIVAG